MSAKHELRKYDGDEKVWVGKYRNSHNLLHWHSDCELIYVEHGSIDVFCSGKNYLLTPGKAMFIQSGEIHYMKAREETYLLVFIFDESLMKTAAGAQRLDSPLLSDVYSIPTAYNEIKRELSDKKPFYAQAANNRMTKLLIDILRGEPLTLMSAATETGLKTLKRLLDDVEDKYADYTFDDAARFMRLSRAYFSVVFHKYVGMTFSQYLNYVKVRSAVAMLQSEDRTSITDVSVRCGFNTIRNFNRAFRDITGYSPRTLPKDYVLAPLA